MGALWNEKEYLALLFDPRRGSQENQAFSVQFPSQIAIAPIQWTAGTGAASDAACATDLRAIHRNQRVA